MNYSLSILLPVYNVEATLGRAVERLLEVASELTERLEILIIDDGSTDLTPDAAREIATRFPQVRLVRHGRRRGLAEAIRAGLDQTTGEIVCVHEGDGPIDAADVQRLWQMRDQKDLILARQSRLSSRGRDGFIERMLGRSRVDRAEPMAAGFHMLRRDAMQALERHDELTVTGYEVRLQRTDARSELRQPVREPNFLTRLRELALGE